MQIMVCYSKKIMIFGKKKTLIFLIYRIKGEGWLLNLSIKLFYLPNAVFKTKEPIKDLLIFIYMRFGIVEFSFFLVPFNIYNLIGNMYQTNEFF